MWGAMSFLTGIWAGAPVAKAFHDIFRCKKMCLVQTTLVLSCEPKCSSQVSEPEWASFQTAVCEGT